MITVNRIKNTGKLTALISFIIGTLLLIVFASCKLHEMERGNIILIGMYYVGVAIIINLLVFTTVLGSALYFWDYRFELFQTCGILLLNIFIAIGYFILVLCL